MDLKRRPSEDLANSAKSLRIEDEKGDQYNNADSGSQYNNTSAGRQYVADQINITENRIERKGENLEFLKDLRLTDPRDDKSRIMDTKGGLLAKSYEWIVDFGDFKKWRSDHSSGVFWISGSPGKGKTMLLCGIIDHLSDPGAKHIPPSFFFFQESDSQLNNATAVLRGLIYLLAIQHRSFLEYLQERYSLSGGTLFADPDNFFALSNVFRNMLSIQTTNPIYLIVDALDECQTDLRKLLDLICQTSSTPSNCVKWIVSSRNLYDIKEVLGPLEHKVYLSLDQNEGLISTAVNTYIDHKVSQLSRAKRYSPEVKAEVQRYLKQNANETFLWVALVCQRLSGIKPWNTLTELHKFPPGLEDMYGVMLGQMLKLDDDDLDFCKSILAVAMIAYRPITFAELPSLVQLEGDISGYTEWLEDIIKLCGSFLVTRQETIYFVHQSAKEYLQAHASARIMPSGIYDVHYNISLQSLKLLMQTLKRDIYVQSQPGLAINQMEKPNPDPLKTIRYSCVYWTHHLHEAYKKHPQRCQDCLSRNGVVYQFLNGFLLYWLEALSLLRRMRAGIIAIEKLEEILEDLDPNSDWLALVEDTRRFVLYNQVLIENAPLQTYASALVFIPAKSLVKESFQTEQPKWMKTYPIMEDSWSVCLQTLEAHGDTIRSVVFSHDHRYLASASSDFSIKIWDAVSGKWEKTLKGHGSCVTSLVFSQDNNLLISGSSDKTIRFWGAHSGKCLQTLRGHENHVRSVVLSHDNQYLISASCDRNIKIWDIAKGDCAKTLQGHQDWVNALALSRKSGYHHLASASSDRTIRIWDTKDCRCITVLKGHSDWVNSIAFKQDSLYLASGSSDKTVRIWDVATSSCVKILPGHSNWVNSVAFSHNGKYLASSSNDATIKIWDSGGKCEQTLRGHSWTAICLTFSPDDQRLISGSSDRTIKVWDMTVIGKSERVLNAHDKWVDSLTFSHDGKYIASISDDWTLMVWSASTGKYMHTLGTHKDMLNGLCFSYDTLLASASSDHTAKIWDIITGECKETLEGHEDCVNSVDFSPDGSLLVSSSGDHTVRVWEVDTGMCIRLFEGHTDSVGTAIFANDGQYIASSSRDKSVRIWSTEQENCIWVLNGHDGWVNSVAFSDDSKYVASTSTDRTIRLWHVRTGVCAHVLHGHKDSVNAVAFSHNGKFLASTSADETIRIWDTDTGKCAAAIKAGALLLCISFDLTDSYLLTKIGRVALRSVLEPKTRKPIWYGYGLSPDLTWITCHGQNLLRVPSEHHLLCSAVFESTVAIGCESGKMFVLEFQSCKLFPLPKVDGNYLLDEPMMETWQAQAPSSTPFHELSASAQVASATPTADDDATLEDPGSPMQKCEPLGRRESDADGRTPLHLAVLSNNESLVLQFLREKEVDQSMRDKHSRTALFYALLQKQKKIALALAEKWNVPDRVVTSHLNHPAQGYKDKSLFNAIMRQNHDEIAFLIEAGANMEARGYGIWPGWKGTALHEAAWFGTPEILQLMLDKGAEKYATDIGGRTPSHHPNWSRTREISKFLS
ncbi:vegetative incompatibility protein HET-E-1 [Nannizzia gypsea CBS 118893]|uniref:Vegetative incompatibility protein HET-E-1 n=1 Tax=Arthroderma gypseum (strain ATCC MYA-4604 / CBS 118893) TaxID=535722 RepID=E4UXQ6_ARTGP|nr:vegetative incompatibility protein HET-E-1 [Nannizzia gypsea CBS 118893]EFR01951.1 vegetative incompatibility protein HET-E-1 [Nannizzia gypsea CBS 118893]